MYFGSHHERRLPAQIDIELTTRRGNHGEIRDLRKIFEVRVHLRIQACVGTATRRGAVLLINIGQIPGNLIDRRDRVSRFLLHVARNGVDADCGLIERCRQSPAPG